MCTRTWCSSARIPSPATAISLDHLPYPSPDRAHADGTASLMPPVYCLRRGRRPKDGPGSVRTAAVSVWLRWGRVARSRQCRRRRAPGDEDLEDSPAHRGLPPRTPLRMGSGRPRCFNPSPSDANAAGSSLHHRGEPPHPELGRSRHDRSVPMSWSTGGHHGYSPGNHPTPEPGLTYVSRDVEET